MHRPVTAKLVAAQDAITWEFCPAHLAVLPYEDHFWCPQTALTMQAKLHKADAEWQSSRKADLQTASRFQEAILSDH